MNKYRGFGLNIATDIQFPELLPADFPEADVTITTGKLPGQFRYPVIISKPFSTLTEAEYTLEVKNLCAYYAANGTTIIVEPSQGADEHSIRLFLLGTVMAAILYQRGSIPFHASAIVKDGKLVLFTGTSGSGKSTLLASLAARGYSVFTDDICVLKLQGEQVLGRASYPMMKLWADVVDHLDQATYNRDFVVRPHLPKYGQFFFDTFNEASLPVDKLFVLSPKNDIDELRAEKLEGAQLFRTLERQAYRYKFMVTTSVRAQFLSLASHITNNIPVYRVMRPVGGKLIDAMADKIESML